MSNEEYIQFIIKMLNQINSNEHLKRIYNYAHKYFIRRKLM